VTVARGATRFKSAFAFFTLTALVAVPSAQAQTIKLNWVEQRSATYFPVAMTFKVKDVTLGKKAWSVRASFTNRSRKAIRITRTPTTQYSYLRFGLGVPAVRTQPGFTNTGLEPMTATYAKPAIPPFLRSGRTWSGVFGGPGLPPKGKLIHVTFGVFTAAGERDWSWVTDHGFKR